MSDRHDDLQHSLFVITEKRKVGQALHPDAEETRTVIAAAKERLRLSKVPCETCGGTGQLRDDSPRPGFQTQEVRYLPCDACNGAGEVWPAALVEVVREQLESGDADEARALLDAVAAWMEAGE